MARHGYFSCLACHDSARGSGILNPYGQGIAKSVSLARGEMRPSKIREAFSFGGVASHALQLRGAVVQKKSDSPDRTDVFPMQFDYLSAFQLAKNVRFDSTIAQAPHQAKRPQVEGKSSLESSLKSDYYFRKILLNYKFDKNFRLAIGRDGLAFGFNIVDHTSFVRRDNKRGITDFFTQLRLDYENKTTKITPYIFMPSFQEAKNNRERGVGFRFETQVLLKGLSVGTSALYGETDSIERDTESLFSKYAWKDLVLLLQLDRTYRKVVQDNKGFLQTSGYSRIYYFLAEYLEVNTGFEFLHVRTPFFRREKLYGIGSSLKTSASTSLQFNGYKIIKSNLKDETLLITQLFINFF